jgi:hypothetical protein
MKTDINVAAWNVQSMLQAGKLHEIADELIKYNTQITALQEVRILTGCSHSKQTDNVAKITRNRNSK